MYPPVFQYAPLNQRQLANLLEECHPLFSVYHTKKGWMVKIVNGTTTYLLHDTHVLPETFKTLDAAIKLLHKYGVFRVTVETEGLDL